MPSAKVYLQVPALVLAIFGFILIFVSLATPAWQVVYARELQQWIQGGLWMNCQTRPSGMHTCTYTFTENDYNFYTSAEVVNIRTPAFYSWQRTLLHLLLLAQLFTFFAFVSFCVSNTPSMEKVACLIFNVFMSLSTMIGLGCMLAFTIFSSMIEYRFYHVSVSGIYEKHRGYSFYISLIANILLLFSLILSVAYTFKVWRKDRWAGGSQETINAYRPPRRPMPYEQPQFSSLYSSEDQFAMRALPDPPTKKKSTLF